MLKWRILSNRFNRLNSSFKLMHTSSSLSRKRIYRSTSDDVFYNLALEDWLYQHSDEELLILWKNSPCVVIGRHQNPWIEANIPYLKKQNIKLARRNSGGGTVFHDHGNLNLSFITNKSQYNRRNNLELICRALRVVGVSAVINERDDILLNGKKISGTAAKLARNRAYHHCTVLVDVDRQSLSQSLKNKYSHEIIKTNATRSIRSPIENISGQVSDITLDEVERCIAGEYAQGADIENFHHDIITGGDEILEIYRNFKSWQWVYGKSPKFFVEDKISVNGSEIEIQLSIVNGVVETLHINSEIRNINGSGVNLVLSEDSLSNITQNMRGLEKECMEIFSEKMSKIL